MLVAITWAWWPRKWPASVRARPADPVARLALAFAAALPLAAPLERRRLGVPVGGDRLQPGDDLLGVAGVLPAQGPALQDPLDALGHVQPRAAQRRVQRHHP